MRMSGIFYALVLISSSVLGEGGLDANEASRTATRTAETGIRDLDVSSRFCE